MDQSENQRSKVAEDCKGMSGTTSCIKYVLMNPLPSPLLCGVCLIPILSASRGMWFPKQVMSQAPVCPLAEHPHPYLRRVKYRDHTMQERQCVAGDRRPTSWAVSI